MKAKWFVVVLSAALFFACGVHDGHTANITECWTGDGPLEQSKNCAGESSSCDANDWGMVLRKVEPGTPMPVCTESDYVNIANGSYTFQDTTNRDTAGGPVPRYACYSYNTTASSIKPLPLIVFLPGTGQDAQDVYDIDVTNLANYMIGTDAPSLYTNDTSRKGYHLLSIEPRELCVAGYPLEPGSTRWEVSYRHPENNPDIQAIDRFIMQFIDGHPGHVDMQRIYVIGYSIGAYFAAIYGVQRNKYTNSQSGQKPPVAAVVQWAGADPWARNKLMASNVQQCPDAQYNHFFPYPDTTGRRTPLLLMHHRCDQPPNWVIGEWKQKLDSIGWPNEEIRADSEVCGIDTYDEQGPCPDSCSCGYVVSWANHIKWPGGGGKYPVCAIVMDALWGFLRTNYHPAPVVSTTSSTSTTTSIRPTTSTTSVRPTTTTTSIRPTTTTTSVRPTTTTTRPTTTTTSICSNQCTPSGANRCNSTVSEPANAGYSKDTCGNYDTDTCLEWGNNQACGSGTFCVETVSDTTASCVSCYDSDGGGDLEKGIIGSVYTRTGTGSITKRNTDHCGDLLGTHLTNNYLHEVYCEGGVAKERLVTCTNLSGLRVDCLSGGACPIYR